MSTYAVVDCRCGKKWTVELRHLTSTCPGCGKTAKLRTRRRLWEGDDPHDAAEAARSPAPLEAPAPVARHDDALDAAAAQGRSERNLSRRAEVVTEALCKLEGEALHDRLMEALERAGLDVERADRERIRLLATDLIYEPRAGVYSSLSS